MSDSKTVISLQKHKRAQLAKKGKLTCAVNS